MFPINQVFKVKKRRLRLLWNDGNQAFWIDVDSPTAWPELVFVSEIETMLINDTIMRTDDPFLEHLLKAVEPDSLEWIKRDLAWEKLKDEVDDSRLFYRKERGLAISRIVNKHGITHQTANRLLRRYWQRGMTQNAFLPDYHNSGAAGKKRKAGSKKVGRPRSVSLGRGCNVGPAIERIFRQVIEKRLLNQNPTSVPDAHARALDVLKAARPTLTAAELPTVQQFRYFYKREYSQTNVLMKQKSPIDYASNYRPLLGTSTAETQGPGYRYQVDATIADIYLLSDYDRTKIVGRPVIYIVTDVFSRMITGLHVSFEGPSWTSAMIAIANTVENKVEYCKRFGIEIEEHDWPVQGLPSRILADKGEFNGTKVEAFCTAFGTTIENATARRGDAKGIVERHFGTLQATFKPYVGGVVGPQISKKRGGEDYRQDATLALSDFTEIIINAVLFRNNYQPLSKYDRCEEMGEDVPAVPLHLWNWGTTNLTGKLRMAPMDLVRINLMPHAEATVSDFGFRLFGCFYTCSEGIQQGWFHRTKNNRPVKVTVAYDLQTANHIYVRYSKSLHDYWVCDLTDSSRRFRNMSFWDVFAIAKLEKKADAKAALEAPIAKGELLKKIDAISKRAEKQKPTAGPLTRKDLGMEIRENKQDEKQLERAGNAFRPERKKHGGPGEVIPLRKESEVDYSYPDLSHLLFEDDDDDSV